MSLDVYLNTVESHKKTGSGIFVRMGGSMQEISRIEWDELYPGREPVVCAVADETTEVYSANITHNLNKMADAAGLYKCLWRPDEIGIIKASQLINPLREGLSKLRNDPEYFRQFNPDNGWGNYEGLVNFVESYHKACCEFQDANVSVWR